MDLRLAARRLWRRPAYSLAAVLILALGLGANVALFSVFSALFLRPLPFRDPDRLVAVQRTQRNQFGRPEYYSASPFDYERWRERSRSLSSISVVWDTDVGISGSGEPESVPAERCTGSTFKTLGVAPELGRVFTEAEAASPVVVISHGLWVRRFARDPAVVGRELRVDGIPHTVIGVMPPEFTTLWQRSDLWVPLLIRSGMPRYTGQFLDVIARLAPGVTRAEAQAEMSAIARSLEREAPATHRGWGVAVLDLRQHYFGDRRTVLLLLLSGVGLVLLIACANLAHLSLAHAVSREGETAVRVALGATRTRLVREQAAESLLLAVLGGLGGLASGALAIDPILAADPDLGRWAPLVGLDLCALAFTVAAVLLTVFLSGLVPLWASLHDLGERLSGASLRAAGGVRHRRLRRALLVTEVGLSLVLLTGASQVVEALLDAARTHPGFETRGLMATQLVLPANRYPQPRDRAAFVGRLLQRLEGAPGVVAVSTAMTRFRPDGGLLADFVPEGEARGEEERVAQFQRISPGYLQAMHARLVSGREFTAADREGSPLVAVVSQGLARRYWPGQDPVGRRIRRPPGAENWTTIVGVFADVRDHGLGFDHGPTIYVPYAQNNDAGFSWAPVTLLVRAAGDPDGVASLVRREIRSLDPDLPLEPLLSVQRHLAGSLAPRRLQAGLLGGFALAGLLLTVAGLYGVTAYAVARRTRELGIRLALGAAPNAVVGLMVGEALGTIAAGVVLGLLGSRAIGGALPALLAGATASDLPLAGAMAALLLTTGATAAWLPARRSSRIDPAQALRQE